MSENDQVLFWLAPRNDPALKSTQNQVNRDSVGYLPGIKGREGLIVAFDRDVQIHGSLLTLGREGDVELSGSQVSRIQCQILLHPITGEILIRDTSSAKNTKVVNVAEPESLFFSKSDNVPRQVVIRFGDPIHLSMGGDNKDLFQYEVIWPARDSQGRQKIESLKKDFVARRKKGRQEVTIYKTPAPKSRYESRIQTAGSGERWLHRKLDFLGAGTFGDVHKTVNMHTGEYFAVKIMRRTVPSTLDNAWRKAIYEEVRLLQTLSYRHVVQYYHSQGFEAGHHPVEIFMDLYEGNVENLIDQNPAHCQTSRFLSGVFEQMLRALMYIASIGIVHRDVKPANILYVSLPPASAEGSTAEGNYRFALTDFGLSKEQVQARTLQKGSPLFMAPEMRISGAVQSYKVDLYSLGVTMLVVGDAGKIYSQPVRKEEDIQPRLQCALQEDGFSVIRPLLRPDPHERPSAQDVFLELWPGDEEAQQMNAMALPVSKELAATKATSMGKNVGRPRKNEGRIMKRGPDRNVPESLDPPGPSGTASLFEPK